MTEPCRTLLEGAEKSLRGEMIFFDWSLSDEEIMEFAALQNELILEMAAKVADRLELQDLGLVVGEEIKVGEKFPFLVAADPKWEDAVGVVVDSRENPDGTTDYMVDLETPANAAERILREFGST